MAKKKLNQLKQTDGRVKPTTLDQIWGDTGLTKYKTLNVNEYEVYLDNLNMAEIQDHAREVGLMPIDSINRLKQTLIQEFKSYTAKYKPLPEAPDTNDITKFSPQVRKILAESK